MKASPTTDDAPALPEWTSLSLAVRAQLRDLARQRAAELRREAIGAFWRHADQWWVDAADHGRRAAARLAARLRHHARQRASARAASGVEA